MMLHWRCQGPPGQFLAAVDLGGQLLTLIEGDDEHAVETTCFSDASVG